MLIYWKINYIISNKKEKPSKGGKSLTHINDVVWKRGTPNTQD